MENELKIAVVNMVLGLRENPTNWRLYRKTIRLACASSYRPAAPLTRVEQAKAGVQAAPDYSELKPEEQTGVLQPFDNSVAHIQKERLAPVIRQIAERTMTEILPCQLQKVAVMVASRKPHTINEGKTTPPVEYVGARNISISFPKAVIESQQDIEDYLAAVRAAYAAELQKNKRITL